MSQLPPKVYLRVAEVASYLDMSDTKIYELIKMGAVPAMKIGRDIRVPREPFLQWLEKQHGNAAES